MCGSTKAPKVEAPDPIAEKRKADAEAAKLSNADLAVRRRNRARNSLLTVGATGTTSLERTPTLLQEVEQPMSYPGSGTDRKWGFVDTVDFAFGGRPSPRRQGPRQQQKSLLGS